jgi:hypothetical protein
MGRAQKTGSKPDLKSHATLVPYMPFLFFIDKDGMIRAQYGGRDTMLNLATQEKTVREKILEMLIPPKKSAK